MQKCTVPCTHLGSRYRRLLCHRPGPSPPQVGSPSFWTHTQGKGLGTRDHPSPLTRVQSAERAPGSMPLRAGELGQAWDSSGLWGHLGHQAGWLGGNHLTSCRREDSTSSSHRGCARARNPPTTTPPAPASPAAAEKEQVVHGRDGGAGILASDEVAVQHDVCGVGLTGCRRSKGTASGWWAPDRPDPPRADNTKRSAPRAPAVSPAPLTTKGGSRVLHEVLHDEGQAGEAGRPDELIHRWLWREGAPASGSGWSEPGLGAAHTMWGGHERLCSTIWELGLLRQEGTMAVASRWAMPLRGFWGD